MHQPRSAHVGQPPLTPDDLLIVRGLFVWLDIDDQDPANGLDTKIAPPPPGVPHESNHSRVIAASAVAITLMTLFTTTRLGIRVSNKSLSWGWDDWAIIVATVSKCYGGIFQTSARILTRRTRNSCSHL